ncbi:MAG: hypothetical protein K8953_12125 [Proteobacteria bacterium]|nr:hypothetical protein [Pseudomonadota bacterium]
MRAIENILAYKHIITAIKDNDKELLEKISTDYKGFGDIKSGASVILHYTARIQSKIDNKDPMLTCFNGNLPNKLDDIKVYKEIMEALYTYNKDFLSKLNINFQDIDTIREAAVSILISVEVIEKNLDVNDHFLKCYNEHYLQ